MATKKITDLTKLTDLDATDSFVVNDSSAGADKRVEFSDLQSEVLNGAVIGGTTPVTQLTVDNLRLDGNTVSSQDTNGNILLQPNGTGDVVINDAGADSDFRVEGDTDANLLFVDASTDRVGIGTSSPTNLLTVAGNANLTGSALIGTSTALSTSSGVFPTLQMASVSASLGGMMLQNATDNNGAPAIYSTKTRSGTTGNYTTAVVNGDFLMFVDGEGSDGVSALRRAGSISINASGTFTPTSSPGYITFNTTPSGSVSTSERLRIDSAGNVGIGTSSPSTKLHVSGSTLLDGAVTINESGADVDFRIESDTNANMVFVDAGQSRVGIGTNAPGAIFGILKSSTFATENTAGIKITDETSDVALLLGADNAVDAGYIQTTQPFTSFTTRNLSLQPQGGNVGIGTAGPAKKLDVIGEIRASTGILFGSDTAAANTLDDYEEGTWTPVYEASVSGSAIMGNQVGKYTKIGNTVFVQLDVSCDKNTLSGDIKISGLPFTASSSSFFAITPRRRWGVEMNMRGVASTTNIDLYKVDSDNASDVAVTDADMSATALTSYNSIYTSFAYTV